MINQCDGCRAGMPLNALRLHVGADGKPHMVCCQHLYQKEPNVNKVVYDSLMIDLETMGTGPNAAVIQLGAVAFNSVNGLADPDGLSLDIDLHSSVLLGGEVDAATAQWWRDRGGLELKEPVPLRAALLELGAWVKNLPQLERVWSQGANFDVPILEGYYRRAGLECPWPYYAARDTRTVYDLAKERGWKKPEDSKAVHHALQDCLIQTKCLLNALRFLREPKE